ncbi:type II secretion system F family protein [Paramicrobacterium chengjingii]|uniref:Tight adherence protein B n=1 Tax=Paramicrobacterium chengjingii TaxID=2769067 RepID=A0ABX6YFQ9_9MICO|nr:hypothetical protein [Microbacterium chengjingii]QPZ37420.1 hypothetical protein HCR76_11295 [Microbacterium chengjingii]
MRRLRARVAARHTVAKRNAPPAVETVASIAERVAVLMVGGVAPALAWHYLDESLGRRDPASRVVHAAATADDVPSCLASAGDDWRVLAATLAVSARCGAPAATALHTLSATLRAIGQTQRDIAAALAGPRSTSRLVMLLPLVGIGFGMLLGFDTWAALATAPGAVCGVLGALLMLGGWRWSSALARRAQPRDTAPGLMVDLTAIALSGGASVPRARAVIDDVAADLGLAGDSGASESAVDDVVALAQRAGVPAADLLRSEAARIRRDAASRAADAAARLSTHLMIPLGVCVLPAFMLLGVAPMMIGIISSTNLGI